MRYQPGQLLRLVSSVTGQIPCLAGSFPPSHRRGGYQPPARYKLTIIIKVGRIRTNSPPDAIRLTPPSNYSLEQCLEFLADDELLEVTPKSLRMRKAILEHDQRMKALHGKK